MTNRAAKTLCLFVTGTDTGVGKTYLAALIARDLRALGLRVGAYKPVCSGAEVSADGTETWGDVETLVAAIGGDFEPERVCPQRLKAPLAPPVAARREGTQVDFDRARQAAAWWDGRVDALLVEGVGGLLCPLTERETIADLAIALMSPVLIVARIGLGTINHTLLTVEAAERRGLTVAGIVLNETDALPSTETAGANENPGEIARRVNVPVLGVVRYGGHVVERGNDRMQPSDWLGLMSQK